MPKYTDARLPEHALAEINEAKGEARSALIRWWESWADVGDARQAERAAFSELASAQLAYGECRAVLQAKHPGQSLPPGACDCGNHARRIDRAQKEREKHLTAIDRAIGKHKVGG